MLILVSQTQTRLHRGIYPRTVANHQELSRVSNSWPKTLGIRVGNRPMARPLSTKMAAFSKSWDRIMLAVVKLAQLPQEHPAGIRCTRPHLRRTLRLTSKQSDNPKLTNVYLNWNSKNPKVHTTNTCSNNPPLFSQINMLIIIPIITNRPWRLVRCLKTPRSIKVGKIWIICTLKGPSNKGFRLRDPLEMSTPRSSEAPPLDQLKQPECSLVQAITTKRRPVPSWTPTKWCRMSPRKLLKTIMTDSKIRKIDKDCRISKEIRILREIRRLRLSQGPLKCPTIRVVPTSWRQAWFLNNRRSKALKWAKSRLSNSSHINQDSIRPTPPCIRNPRRPRNTILVTIILVLKMPERATETPYPSTTPPVPTEWAPTTECHREPASRSRKTDWAGSVPKDSRARSLT